MRQILVSPPEYAAPSSVSPFYSTINNLNKKLNLSNFHKLNVFSFSEEDTEVRRFVITKI